METIVFPSFSSPSSPLSEDVCVQVMLNTVDLFADKRDPHSSNPMDVHFIIDQDETLKVFQVQFDNLFRCNESQKSIFSKVDHRCTGNLTKHAGTERGGSKTYDVKREASEIERTVRFKTNKYHLFLVDYSEVDTTLLFLV